MIERFLGIEEVPDTSSLSLKNTLDGMFASHGLSMSRLCGHGAGGIFTRCERRALYTL